MQLAVAALGKVFAGLGLGAASAGTAGTAAAAAGTAATAAGTAATSAGLGSGALTALSGISTVFKVLGGISAGNEAARQAEDAAVQTELQSGQEQLQATQRQTGMKRELARVLGQNDVTYAAAGIDISSGAAQSAAASAQKRATDEISIDQQDTDFKRALYRMRASGQRRQGQDVQRSAMLGAIGDIAQFGISAAGVGGK